MGGGGGKFGANRELIPTPDMPTIEVNQPLNNAARAIAIASSSSAAPTVPHPASASPRFPRGSLTEQRPGGIHQVLSSDIYDIGFLARAEVDDTTASQALSPQLVAQLQNLLLFDLSFLFNLNISDGCTVVLALRLPLSLFN